MTQQKPKKRAPVVAVINMKGGVGKTTISGNVMRELYRTKSIRTLVVDFDPQFNLSQLLMSRDVYDGHRDAGRTILSVFEPPTSKTVFSVTTATAQPVPSCDSVSVRIKHLQPPPESIEYRLVPGDFRLALYNLRESPDSLSGPRARFKQFIEAARDEFGLVVLDCNPSSSFLTRAALEAATHLLTPIRPDRYSLLGVEMLRDFVNQLPSVPVKPQLMLLLNGVAANHVPPEETTIRSHPEFGPLTLVNKVPHSTILTARSDYAGFGLDRRAPYSKSLRQRLGAVADEIAKKLGVA